MDNTRTVTDAKQQKIKIKKDVITSSMSTIVDRTCYVFFFNDVFSVLKFCPNILETVDLRLSHQNFRDCSWLNIDGKRRNCPARCASAANAIESDTDMFSGRLVSVNMIKWYLILLVCFIH
jgi:hypothetical protein